MGEDENRWQGELYSEMAGNERAWMGWLRGESLGGGKGPRPSRDGTKNVGARRVKGRCRARLLDAMFMYAYVI